MPPYPSKASLLVKLISPFHARSGNYVKKESCQINSNVHSVRDQPMQAGNPAAPNFHVVVLPEVAIVAAYVSPAEDDADKDSAVKGKEEDCSVVRVKVRLKLP